MVSGKALSVDDWDNPQPEAQDEDDDGGSWGGGGGTLEVAGEMGRPRVGRRWMSGMRCVHSEKSVAQYIYCIEAL